MESQFYWVPTFEARNEGDPPNFFFDFLNQKLHINMIETVTNFETINIIIIAADLGLIQLFW